MTMEPSGAGRMVVSLAVLGLLAALGWRTMEPGRYQQATWLLLGFFAFRVVLGWARSRRMEYGASPARRDRLDV